MPRNLLATGLITPTTWEPANLGPEGTRLAELTLRSLAGIFRSSASDVYVCENPSILVTAADALGLIRSLDAIDDLANKLNSPKNNPSTGQTLGVHAARALQHTFDSVVGGEVVGWRGGIEKRSGRGARAQMAREDLESGITTVRNLGHSGVDGDTALRDAIAQGRVEGPRILASGRKLITAKREAA